MDYLITFLLIAIFALWLIFMIITFAVEKGLRLKIDRMERRVHKLEGYVGKVKYKSAQGKSHSEAEKQ